MKEFPFDILRYLVENAGRLVTHNELLEALWPDVHVQPEVLKGQILSIRSALGDKVQKPQFIETLRGRGYRFISPVRDHHDATPAKRRPEYDHQVLVGRTQSLAELNACLTEALAGQPRLAFVVGEAGIGKTTLVEEFVAGAVADHDLLASRGQCVEGYGGIEPYYPVLDALDRLCKSSAGRAVVQNLISLAPTWALQLPTHIPFERRAQLHRDIVGAGRERMLREICELLESLSLRQPLVLVFEDLHWADYSTVDVLSALARRPSRSKLMVIATYRSEDAEGRLHPVRQVHRALLLRKLVREVALEPLGEHAIAEFLVGGNRAPSAPADLVRLVQEHSGGNPLFMMATLHNLTERGFIDHVGHTWQARTSLARVAYDVPLTLSQVIEARVERLTDQHRRALEAGSVAGISFNARITASAAGLSPVSFEDACEELCRKQSFIRHADAGVAGTGSMGQDDEYVFRHAVYRQVLYERQGALRRAQTHFRIGERLETLSSPERRTEIATELAQHFAAAEEWTRALVYLRIALQRAKQRFAQREALEILHQAMTLAAHLPTDARVAAELEFLEGRASIYAATHDRRAAEAYSQLVSSATEHANVDVQARALLGRAYAVSWRDQQHSLQLLEQALQLSARQPDPQLQARTRVSAHVWRLWTLGWSDADVRECEQALSVLRRERDPLTAAWAAIEYTMIGMVSSRYREVLDNVQTNYHSLFAATEGRPEFNMERAVWMKHLGVPWALLFLGELGKSLDEFDSGIALFARNSNKYAVVTLGLYRALLLLHCGDFTGVLEFCTPIAQTHDAHPQLAEDGTDTILPAEYRLCRLMMGLAEAGLGNKSAALRYLSDVERCMNDQPVIFDWYWRLALEWGLTNIFVAAGDQIEASVHVERFLALASETKERTWQGLAWETKARLSLSQGDYMSAADCITNAFNAGKGYSTPLADWRVHATAATVFTALGDPDSARHHTGLSEKGRKELAESLPDGHRLRTIFEGAP